MIVSPRRFFLLTGLILLAGCSPFSPPKAPAAPPTYAWPQASAAPPAGKDLPSALPQPSLARVAPAPSPTPREHVVAAGETLGALAQRYGLSLDELLAANPGIQPQAIGVGQRILIPSPQNLRQWLPTPLPLKIEPVRCFEQTDGAWCVGLVSNPGGQAAALISGEIRLFDSAGNLQASQPAFSLLENLPAGAKLPLAAFFSPFPRQTAQASLILQTAFDASAALPAPQVRGLLVQVSLSGLAASAEGSLFLPQNAPPLSRVWLAAVGFDKEGNLCAFRRVEVEQPLQPGESLPFSVDVYSLGPALWRVQVYAEGH